jgi:hypothetical protein
MQPLGFRFDVDTVIVGSVAHRADCSALPARLPEDVVSLTAVGVYRSQRRPRACSQCGPSFETLLSYQLDRRITTPVTDNDRS